MKQHGKTKQYRIAETLAIGSFALLALVSQQTPLQAKQRAKTPTATPTRTHTPKGSQPPVVPPLTITPTPLPGGTPLPTITVDPQNPMSWDEHYVTANAALDSLNFNLLPGRRDTKLQAFRFTWDAGWVPPDLSNIPSMIYLPGGIPYMLKFHVVLRQPNDPLGKSIDRYPLSGKNEVILYDSELASGEWEWAVRGEYMAGGGWKLYSPWSAWQIASIRK